MRLARQRNPDQTPVWPDLQDIQEGTLSRRSGQYTGPGQAYFILAPKNLEKNAFWWQNSDFYALKTGVFGDMKISAKCWKFA